MSSALKWYHIIQNVSKTKYLRASKAHLYAVEYEYEAENLISLYTITMNKSITFG